MDHGNYLKLCFSRTCLPSNPTNTWGNLSIFIRPPSSLPGVVANGQPHLRWERHRTASPTRPNDTVPGVSVVFPGWANFWWWLERGLRFSLAFLVGICWKVGKYCIFKNIWYTSCVVYLDFCWAGRKTQNLWEMCWHLMEWWHVKAEQKGVAVCRPIKSGSTRFLSKPETASRKPSPETIRCFTIIRHLGKW